MSQRVSLGDAIDTLQMMFSHIPRHEIQRVLASNRGVMELTVDALLRRQQGSQVDSPVPTRQTASPASIQSVGDIDAQILHLEQHKLLAVQNEQFLRAEELKNQISVLQGQKASLQQASISQSSTQSQGFVTEFDDLTPLFLRRRNSRRRLELPDDFLRSPAFRQLQIDNKILASGLALQMHDDDMQQVQQRPSNSANGVNRSRSHPANTSQSDARAPNKAALFFKNIGDKAKEGFQKFKESLNQRKKPGSDIQPLRGKARRRTLDEKELLDDGLSSPTSRGRAESNQEYAAMGDDGNCEALENDDGNVMNKAGSSSAARNQMLWKMNRKAANSIRGFELKDIGTAPFLPKSSRARSPDSSGGGGGGGGGGGSDDDCLQTESKNGYVDIEI